MSGRIATGCAAAVLCLAFAATACLASDARAQSAAAPAGEWPLAGRDYANTQRDEGPEEAP